jgi:magnesium chelatase family protein
VGRIESGEYTGPPGEPSAAVLERVTQARVIQADRGRLNRHLLPGPDTGETAGASGLVAQAVDNSLLTARGGDRVRRVARTIADLAESVEVEESHMAEAIGLRGEWRDG